MRHLPASWIVLLLLAVGSTSCGGGARYHLVGVQPVYTLTNLHPDARRLLLYSQNYQQDGLIPVCTPVLIHSVNKKEMRFTVLSTNQRFSWRFERRTMVEPIEVHLDRYFGPTCKAEYLATMSPIDQQGVRDGQVYAGMTREGVILAAGYPPPNETNLSSDVWRYWRNRYNSFQVFFVNGVVQYMRD